MNESDRQPQFQLGATSDDAVRTTPLPGPGGIVKRLGQQFQLPRAEPDSEISRDTHGLPNG